MQVRSPAGHSLSLESPTRRLALTAPAGVAITSQSGRVEVAALRDVVFKARGRNSQESGNIYLSMHCLTVVQFKIDAGTILLPRLGRAGQSPHHRGSPHHNQTVYQAPQHPLQGSGQTLLAAGHHDLAAARMLGELLQLCICRSGRLFLAPALSHCVADSHVCRDQP